MHNSYNRLPSNLKFGWFFTFVCIFFSAIFFYKKNYDVALAGSLMSAGFLIATIFFPKKLEGLNKAWFLLGISLGKITNPLVLLILYLFLITPISLVTRLFGRDYLKTKIRNKTTYWISRDANVITTFRHQF